MDIEELRGLVERYGDAEWDTGYEIGRPGATKAGQDWRRLHRDNLRAGVAEQLQALSDEMDALRADVTDYKAKAQQFKLSWQAQRDVIRNYDNLLTAYQQAPAAALVCDLDGVTDGIQDEELWRAGVKLLRMALKDEK